MNLLDVTKSCRDINELNPTAQKACRLFLQECEKAGIKIFITETYRSQARQNYLYEQGRTRGGNIVTWTKSSRHTGRMAWDIACNGSNLYDVSVLAAAGAIAKELGITWGGTWETPDRPHFEVTADWREPEKEGKAIMEKRYNTLADVPEWGKEALKILIDKGIFADKNNLNLSEDMIRMFVFNHRLGVF